LLGREGFAKALQMKKDLRQSKKDGLESAAERSAKQKKSSPPPKKKSKEEDVCIDDIKEIEKGDENKKRFSFFKYQLPKVDFLEEEKEIEVKDQNDFLKIN